MENQIYFKFHILPCMRSLWQAMLVCEAVSANVCDSVKSLLVCEAVAADFCHAEAWEVGVGAD